jgi:hypothetical protein
MQKRELFLLGHLVTLSHVYIFSSSSNILSLAVWWQSEMLLLASAYGVNSRIEVQRVRVTCRFRPIEQDEQKAPEVVDISLIIEVAVHQDRQACRQPSRLKTLDLWNLGIFLIATWMESTS